MTLVESAPVLDTLKHEALWLSKGQWSKMTWAGAEMNDSASGASATSFGTTSGAFFNASEYNLRNALSIVHNNVSPISERFVSLWLCYNDATHSGYRIKFMYTAEAGTPMKAFLYRVESGVETLIGESAAFTTEAGMILAAEKTSTSLVAWVKKAGVWTKLAEVATTTFTKGDLGFDGSGSNPTFTELRAYAANYSDFVKALPGLVSYWRLSESAGATTATDSFGTNNGKYESEVTAGEPGLLTNNPATSALFKKTGPGHVTIANSASLALGDVLSAGAWIKRSATGEAVIVAQQLNAFVLWFAEGDKLVLRKGSVANIVASTSTITDTNIHFVAFTKNGATIKLYIDGVDVTGTITNQTLANATEATMIGMSGGNAASAFNGDIQEVFVCNQALTATQIKELYEQGTAPVGPVPAETNPGTQKNGTGTALELKISATNALTYHAKSLPVGLTLNETTGVITGTPTKEETVLTEVEAVGKGGSVKQTFIWTIAAPPTITNPGTQRSGLGMFDELNVPVSKATSVTATGVPPGMSMRFASNTVTFTGQPTIPGTYTTVLEATGEGGTTTSSFTWIIEPLAIARGKAGAIRDKYPLHLSIGNMDFTSLLTETFTFSNVDPGGYEMASFSLPGDLPEILRGMNVRLDCSLGVVWEGRVKEVDRTLGTKTLIQCEGYGALLKDTSIQEIYIDQDFTRWTGLAIATAIALTEKNILTSGPELHPDTAGNGAIATTINGKWESPYLPFAVCTYISPVKIGRFWFGWQVGSQINTADTNWRYGSNGGNKRPNKEGSEENTYLAPGPNELDLSLEYKATPAGADGAQYAVYWKVAVYGRHGLTPRGTAPGGLYTYDIVTHAVSKVADIQTGIIVPEGGWKGRLYTVVQAAYLQAVGVEQVISDMAKLQGAHWGVWESLTPLTGDPRPRLDFRPYSETPTAWAWRSECEDVDVREDLQNLFDTALVSYTEGAGQEHTVEVKRLNAQLEAAGISGKTINLNMGTGTEASAKAYGEIVLALLEDQAKCTGTATIADEIHAMNGAPLAPFMLKAGIDRLRIPDLPSIDAWGENSDLPISRVECTGSPEGITTSLSFGRGPNLVEELTARLERATELAVQGG